MPPARGYASARICFQTKKCNAEAVCMMHTALISIKERNLSWACGQGLYALPLGRHHGLERPGGTEDASLAWSQDSKSPPTLRNLASTAHYPLLDREGMGTVLCGSGLISWAWICWSIPVLRATQDAGKYTTCTETAL